MRRSLGISFGVFTQALFLLTVWHLFRFLHGDEPGVRSGSLWWDVVLTLQYVVVHSVLLHPATKKRLGRWITPEFYGSFFCVATCGGLLLTITAWQDSGVVLWRLEGWERAVVEVAFAASWIALFYSLNLSGLGYQTGWTPWWHWVRRKPLPRRSFQPRGAYHWIRHPIYLSFLGLIWFTPVMTRAHALLTGVWTIYIFVGSYLKDERLAYYLGTSYRRYEQQVTGYPLFLFGPLARRKVVPATTKEPAPKEPTPTPAHRPQHTVLTH